MLTRVPTVPNLQFPTVPWLMTFAVEASTLKNMQIMGHLQIVQPPRSGL